MERWEVVARLKIREAIDKNFYLYDHDRFAEAYATFAEDGVLEPPPGQQIRRGRADILSRFDLRPDGRLGGYARVRHHLTTHYVESLTPDEATARSYYFIYLDDMLAAAGVFDDTFVNQNGEWLVSHRKITQDFLNVEPPKHL